VNKTAIKLLIYVAQMEKQLFPVAFEFVYSAIILKKENDCKIE